MKLQSTLEAITLVFLYSDIAKGIPSRNCLGNKFQCRSGWKCIPKPWVCDGSPDCSDGSDEEPSNCPEGVTLPVITCKETQFQCDNSQCIPRTWKCDGTDDCGDNSDEKDDICKIDCSSSEFKCHDGQCITDKWRCDGHPDCSDNSDEAGCPAQEEKRHTDSSDAFVCDNGFHIATQWVCDGDPDCVDRSDEENCNGESSSISDHGDEICPEHQFRCPGSFCIPRRWHCDGEVECPNGEDEKDCIHKFCAPGLFRCADGFMCIQRSSKCDGIRNCLDGSDEKSCDGDAFPFKVSEKSTSTEVTQASVTHTSTLTPDEEAVTVPISCDEETEFKCSDGACIPKKKLCNNQHDCSDREDESIEVCGIKECSRNNGGCAQICIDTREGHECQCATGFRLVGKYNCEDINECVDIPGTCSQICTNTEGGFRCSCMLGYLRDPADLTRCKASEGDVYLLFSHSYDIRSLRLRDRDMISVVNDTRSAIALDYLFAEGKILWSDKKDKKIYRANIADTSSKEVLVSDDDVSADGLAVDWIHHNVYYTDTVKSAIKMLSWDAKYAKTIVKEKLGHPRAIVVAPMKGYIYWTDWGSNPKIERATLDGSSREAIVTDPHVVWPNGLTIDPSMDKIYWCDGRMRTIKAANLDGSDVKVILYSPTFLRQPFSISVFEDQLYWTDWTNTALFSANKFTGANIQNVSAGHLLESPKVVHVYHQYRQPEGINICEDHSCSQFCVRNPSGKAVCTCADGFALHVDGMQCEEEEEDSLLTTTTVPNAKITTVVESVESKQVEETVGNIEKGFLLYKKAERSSQVGFIIGGCFGALVVIAVILALFAVWSKTRQKPVKRIRFYNPVYRKTTAENIGEDRGFTISPGQLLFTPTNSCSRLSIAEEQIIDADDVPLTRNEVNCS